jgi:hypothetical protein
VRVHASCWRAAELSRLLAAGHGVHSVHTCVLAHRSSASRYRDMGGGLGLVPLLLLVASAIHTTVANCDRYDYQSCDQCVASFSSYIGCACSWNSATQNCEGDCGAVDSGYTRTCPIADGAPSDDGAQFTVLSGPCTTTEGGACVGRLDYGNSETCEIRSNMAAEITYCPAFETERGCRLAPRLDRTLMLVDKRSCCPARAPR